MPAIGDHNTSAIGLCRFGSASCAHAFLKLPTETKGAAVGIVAIVYMALFNLVSLAFNCKLHPQRKQAATSEPSRFEGTHWAKRYTGPFWLWITNRCAGRSFAADPGLSCLALTKATATKLCCVPLQVQPGPR